MRTIPWHFLFFIAALASSPLVKAQVGFENHIPPIDIGATFTTERTKVVAGHCGCFWLKRATAADPSG